MPIFDADKAQDVIILKQPEAGLRRQGQRIVLRQEDDDGLRRREKDAHLAGAVVEEVARRTEGGRANRNEGSPRAALREMAAVASACATLAVSRCPAPTTTFKEFR